jgi:hypothetical protein
MEEQLIDRYLTCPAKIYNKRKRKPNNHLFDAAKSGHNLVIDWLLNICPLEKRYDVNSNYKAKTALLLSLEYGHFKTARFLIEQGADPLKPSHRHGGRTPFEYIIEERKNMRFNVIDMAKIMINHIKYLSTVRGKSLHWFCLKHREYELINFLAEKGLGPDGSEIKSAIIDFPNTPETLECILKHNPVVSEKYMGAIVDKFGESIWKKTYQRKAGTYQFEKIISLLLDYNCITPEKLWREMVCITFSDTPYKNILKSILTKYKRNYYYNTLKIVLECETCEVAYLPSEIIQHISNQVHIEWK